MIDLCPHLRIHTKPAVQRIPRPCDQAHRKLALKHKNAHARRRRRRQQLEHERRADLVGRVADANIKVGQVRLDDVAQQDVEAFLGRCALHALGQLGGHARVHFDGDAAFGFGQDARCQIACARTDFEHDVGLFEGGFVDDCVGDAGVFEDVLPGGKELVT